MIKEGKFGVSEAVWLVTIAITAKAFYTSPAALASIVGTTGWLVTLISAATAAVAFTVLYHLLKRFPGKNLIEIFELTLGRYGGFIFSGSLALFLFLIAALRARELTEVLKVYVLPESPTIFILGICIVSVAYVCSLGLEPLARFSRLIIAAMLIGFFLVLALGWQNYDLSRLFPIYGYGIGQTLAQGIVRSSVYGEVIILAVFAGALQGVEHIKKAGYTSLLLAAFFVSVSLLTCSLTFPYYGIVEVTSPIYELSTLVDYGRYLQRLESVFIFAWVLGSFISIAAVFYAFTSIYCKMFRIQDAKPMLLPAGLLLLSLAMAPKDFSSLALGGVYWLRQYGGIFFFIPPMIALLAARLRGKGAKAHG